MLRNCIGFGILFVLLFLNACAPLGPKPDKSITATLELMAENPSEEDINNAILALQRRFEKFNAYPSVERIDSSASLRFTLETHAEADRIRNYLITPGNLEFYPLVANEELIPFFTSADAWLMENDSLEPDPIVSKFGANATAFGWEPFSVAEKDTAAVGRYLRRNGVRKLLLPEHRPSKFLWGLRDRDSENFPLHCVKITKSGGAPLDGSRVIQAYQHYDMRDMPVIGIEMNAEGAAIWERLTEDAYQNNSLIAIVVDGVVYSAPGVASGPIKGGRSEISGDFTLEEARDLAGAVGSGAIPKMKILKYSSQPLQ